LPGFGPEFANVINSANCSIQNLGKGPAFITEVVAKLKFSSAPLPFPPVFNDCIKVIVLQPVVTESEPTNFFVRGQGADGQTAVRMGDPSGPELFSCYGVIKYRDAFGESYCTTFGFSRQWLRRADSEEIRWMFVPNLKYQVLT
jgi:hypothetical protein